MSDKEYPIHFGFAALSNFSTVSGVPIDQLLTVSGAFTLEMSIKLIWAGLKQGARKEKIPFTLEWEDVADFLDETPSALEQAMLIFTTAMGAPTNESEKSGNVKPAVKKTPVKR